eukprot:gene7931-9321_t
MLFTDIVMVFDGRDSPGGVEINVGLDIARQYHLSHANPLSVFKSVHRLYLHASSPFSERLLDATHVVSMFANVRRLEAPSLSWVSKFLHLMPLLEKLVLRNSDISDPTVLQSLPLLKTLNIPFDFNLVPFLLTQRTITNLLFLSFNKQSSMKTIYNILNNPMINKLTLNTTNLPITLPDNIKSLTLTYINAGFSSFNGNQHIQYLCIKTNRMDSIKYSIIHSMTSLHTLAIDTIDCAWTDQDTISILQQCVSSPTIQTVIIYRDIIVNEDSDQQSLDLWKSYPYYRVVSVQLANRMYGIKNHSKTTYILNE